MTWHFLLVDADGLKLTSSPLGTRDDAIHFALDRDKDGLKVLRIESDTGDVVKLGDIGLAEEDRERREVRAA